MKAWWFKKGPGKAQRWGKMVNGEYVDWNDEFIRKSRTALGEVAVGHSDQNVIRMLNDQHYAMAEAAKLSQLKQAEIDRQAAARMKGLRTSLGAVAEGKTDEEVHRLVTDHELLRIETHKLSSDPWADLTFKDGKLTVKHYNDAFVSDLRVKLGDVVSDDMSDDQIVALYVDRENIEREEPRLEVVHFGIEEDGQLKIKLDWNKAFIDHLRKNGITGETEDEAIKEYLSRLTTETADAQGEIPDVISRDKINEAFATIDHEAQRELDEAAAQVKTPRRRRKKAVE